MFVQNSKSAAVLTLCVLGLVSSSALGAQEPEQLQKNFSFLGNVTAGSEKGLVVTTYYLSSHTGYWSVVRDDCIASFQNGALVSIETEEENILLGDSVGDNSGSGLTVFTAGLFAIEDQEWRWAGTSNESIIEYQNWCVEKPINPNGRQRVRLNFSPVENKVTPCWESWDDDKPQRFICEVTSVSVL